VSRGEGWLELAHFPDFARSGPAPEGDAAPQSAYKSITRSMARVQTRQ